MSSSRLNPSVTPRTLFATSARIRPWKARERPSSFERVNCTTLFSIETPMPGTTGVVRVPLGPFTVTTLPSCLTSTPFGTGISFLPIRDIGISLPDLAEDFAADAALDGFLSGQHAFGGRDDGQAEAAEDARDLLLVAVDAAARARDALDAVDDRLAARRVFEVDPERTLGLVLLLKVVVADEALILEDAGDLHFQLRRGKLDAFVMRLDSVANPREHVRDWVCHRHS